MGLIYWTGSRNSTEVCGMKILNRVVSSRFVLFLFLDGDFTEVMKEQRDKSNGKEPDRLASNLAALYFHIFIVKRHFLLECAVNNKKMICFSRADKLCQTQLGRQACIRPPQS